MGKTNDIYFYYAFVLENARSSQNWIGPIQYFSAEWDRRFSTDPVLTVDGGGGAAVSGYM